MKTNFLALKVKPYFNSLCYYGIESNEMFLLDEQERELKMEKEIYLLFDVFNVDYNNKKIISKIYEIIAENINKNQDFQLERMSLDIRNYILQEINELPFEFTMKQELDIPDILKLYNLKIDSENYTNILERVEILIDIMSTLKIVKILVVPNLKLFLDDEQLVELYKYSLYNNVNLLLIERKIGNRLKYEKTVVIDENFDEFVI